MARSLWLVVAVGVGCSSADPPADAGRGDAGAQDAGRTPDAAVGDDAAVDAGDALDAGGGASYRWEALDASGEGPFGRWGFVVADLGDGTAILFGGTTIDVIGNGERLDDTWRIDARGPEPSFTLLETVGRPAQRYCGCISFDSTRGRVLLVGGRDTEPLQPETWALDVESLQWSLLPVADTPPGSVGCAMAYSPEADATILFGGGGRGQYDEHTYRLDAAAAAWTILAATGPSARYDSVLRWVGPGEPLLLFGGALGAIGDGFHADVWRFDVAAELWSETVAEGPRPPGRRVGWLALEPEGAGFVVGMGATGIQPDQVLSDLWRFDFTARRWRDRTPMDSPPARGFSPWVPGGADDLGLLLGGFDNQAPRSDLFRLRPASE